MTPKRLFDCLSCLVSQSGRHLLVLGFLALILGGCYTLEVVKAFDGKFPPEQNNKLIIEYCQGCHIHKDFVPATHLDTVKTKYTQKKYQDATECRTCHYVETQFMRNELIRKTKRPKDISRLEEKK